MSGEIEAVGASLAIDGVAFPANLIEYHMPDRRRTALNVTPLGVADGYHAFKGGKVMDGGQWRFVFDYDPEVHYFDDSALHHYRLTFPLESGQPEANYIEFNGLVVNIGQQQGMSGVLKRITLMVQQSGAHGYNLPVAPPPSPCPEAPGQGFFVTSPVGNENLLTPETLTNPMVLTSPLVDVTP